MSVSPTRMQPMPFNQEFPYTRELHFSTVKPIMPAPLWCETNHATMCSVKYMSQYKSVGFVRDILTSVISAAFDRIVKDQSFPVESEGSGQLELDIVPITYSVCEADPVMQPNPSKIPARTVDLPSAFVWKILSDFSALSSCANLNLMAEDALSIVQQKLAALIFAKSPDFVDDYRTIIDVNVTITSKSAKASSMNGVIACWTKDSVNPEDDRLIVRIDYSLNTVGKGA